MAIEDFPKGRYLTVDLHNHACLKRSMFSRDIGSKKKKFLSSIMERATWPLSKRTTFPALEEGKMDVVLSTNYIPENEWREDITLIKWILRLFPSVREKMFDGTYFSTTKTMMDDMEQSVRDYNDQMDGMEARPVVLVESGEQLEEALSRDVLPITFIHSVEGAHSLQGEVAGKEIDVTGELTKEETGKVLDEMIANLEYLHGRGCAYLTLAHFYPNHAAYPIFPYPEESVPGGKWKEMYGRWDMTKGLTPIGEEIVRRMLELGMLIDVTHCTPLGRKQVYDIVEEKGATECLFASHIGAYELNRDPMNLKDWELKWFADRGCIAGVIFMNYWLTPVNNGMGLKNIEATIDHIKKVTNATVPAIGTDFDGFTDPPDEVVDPSQFGRFVKYMEASMNYTEQELRNILGLNALRLLKNGWKG